MTGMIQMRAMRTANVARLRTLRNVLIASLLASCALSASGCWLFVAGAAGAGAGYVAGHEAGEDEEDNGDE